MKTSRTLAVVAISAAFVSVGCFAGAYALASGRDSGSHEIVTRDIPWDGSPSMSLGVEADLHYVQSSGPAVLTARGPQRSIATLSISGGHVQDGLLHTGARLELTLRAPSVSTFVVGGKSRLVIEAYDQPRLAVTVEGRASVEAAGRTEEITLAAQGRARVNLARLDAARVAGSVAGNATVVAAPQQLSRIEVRSGASVVLLSRPAEQANRILEAGSVIDASN